MAYTLDAWADTAHGTVIMTAGPLGELEMDRDDARPLAHRLLSATRQRPIHARRPRRQTPRRTIAPASPVQDQLPPDTLVGIALESGAVGPTVTFAAFQRHWQPAGWYITHVYERT